MNQMQEVSDAVRDPRRLAALADTGLLDSEVEEQFDRLTRLASRLLGVAASFFSLVDEDRDFYKSCFGFEDPLAKERELTGVTFCHYSLVSDGALVIPDTRADPVYRTVPTVESLGVAAYLGVPVHAPTGEVLGSFCAIDLEPRDWKPLEIEMMKELAKSAEREIAIRHWMRDQRRLLDRELDARESLERAIESRGRLMRGFTHDVKNPLGSADGFLSLLEDELLGPLSEKQKESIGRARRSIGAALGLIDELVEIGRAEAAELVVERQPVDLRALAVDMAEEYRAQGSAKGLRVVAEVPDALPVVRSDAARIRQILSNLLSNAVKFTSEGQIVLEAGLRSKEGDAPGGGDWVAIEVSDTGPGIAESEWPRLFEEFTRIDPGTTSGAGLGLAISQRLAAALGGRLTLTSEEGRGSRFSLWLPVSPAPAPPPPTARPPGR